MAKEASKQSFGERLASARREAGLTQDELGAKCEVTGAAVSAWEVGRNEPNPKQLAVIGEVLRVSLDYLIRGAANDSEHKTTARG